MLDIWMGCVSVKGKRDRCAGLKFPYHHQVSTLSPIVSTPTPHTPTTNTQERSSPPHSQIPQRAIDLIIPRRHHGKVPQLEHTRHLQHHQEQLKNVLPILLRGTVSLGKPLHFK